MKMYVLLYVNWDTTEVLGVFDSKAKATKAMKKAGFETRECEIVVKSLNEIESRNNYD